MLQSIKQSKRLTSSLLQKSLRNYAIAAEYVWIDGSGVTTRSKAKTLTKPVKSLADIPKWNYDGSSCY